MKRGLDTAGKVIRYGFHKTLVSPSMWQGSICCTNIITVLPVPSPATPGPPSHLKCFTFLGPNGRAGLFGLILTMAVVLPGDSKWKLFCLFNHLLMTMQQSHYCVGLKWFSFIALWWHKRGEKLSNYACGLNVSDKIEYILLWKNIYNLLNLLLLYLIWHLLPICWCPYVCVTDQRACTVRKEGEGWPAKSTRNEYHTSLLQSFPQWPETLSFPPGPLSLLHFPRAPNPPWKRGGSA